MKQFTGGVRFVFFGGYIGVMCIIFFMYTSDNQMHAIHYSVAESPVDTINPRPTSPDILEIQSPNLTHLKAELDIFDGNETLQNFTQNDARIIAHIKKYKILIPPSSKKYNLENAKLDPSKGQSTVVKQISNGMKNGFFVECGALDGETRSNTLSLEKDFGWKGLLIEAGPKNFNMLLGKHRKAWAANVCLATKPYPHKVLFEQNFNVGKIYSDVSEIVDKSSNSKRRRVRIKCFPLFSLLVALNISTVDYFSLDIEGHELKVLQNIPFDKILIKVLSIEYIHLGKNGSQILSELMKSKGYNFVTTVTNSMGLANDLIFAHGSIVINETIKPIYT